MQHQTHPLPPAAVTVRDAAAYLAVGVDTLNKWRAQGRGPVFTRIGRRAIRYCIADLDRFMQDGTVHPIE